MKKTRIFVIGGVAILLIALAVAYFRSKPNVTITLYEVSAKGSVENGVFFKGNDSRFQEMEWTVCYYRKFGREELEVMLAVFLSKKAVMRLWLMRLPAQQAASDCKRPL